MRSVTIPLLVLLLLSLRSQAAPATSVPATITLNDTSCTCHASSGEQFDCRSFLRFYSGQRLRLLQRRRGRMAAVQRILQYLDSIGYQRPELDSSSGSTVTILPHQRTVLVDERLRYLDVATDTLPVIERTLTFPRPFNAREIADRAAAISRHYMEQGYPYAKIITDFETSPSPDSLTLVFNIALDSPYVFASPRLLGPFTIQKKYLINDIRVMQGAPFTMSAIDASVTRLLSRRYIASAEAAAPELVPQSDSLKDTLGSIAVPFYIADRTGMGLDGALGFEFRENESPLLQGNVEFSLINMFHAGEEASLSYEGDQTEQRLGITFERPWFAGWPLFFSVAGGLEIEEEQYGYLYGAVRALYETALRWRIGAKLSGSNSTGNGTGEWSEGSYTGVDLIVMRENEPLSDGTLSRSIYLATGSGVTKKERRYSRSHVDFSAMAHLPLFSHQALLLRGFTGHLITGEKTMLPAELYRAGGTWSLRGYAEDEFAFRTVFRGQSEYLYYFQKNASVYLLCDGGVGFTDAKRAISSYTRMFGYGAGLRLPVAAGTFTLAWARSIDDRKSPGRVHVRLQSALSTLYGRRTSLTGN